MGREVVGQRHSHIEGCERRSAIPWMGYGKTGEVRVWIGARRWIE